MRVTGQDVTESSVVESKLRTEPRRGETAGPLNL